MVCRKRRRWYREPSDHSRSGPVREGKKIQRVSDYPPVSAESGIKSREQLRTDHIMMDGGRTDEAWATLNAGSDDTNHSGLRDRSPSAFITFVTLWRTHLRYAHKCVPFKFYNWMMKITNSLAFLGFAASPSLASLSPHPGGATRQHC